MATLADLFVPGKPILLTAGSANGAELMAKEETWKKGKEARIVDVEMLDEAFLRTIWSGLAPDDIVIITGARRADEVVQTTLGEIMHVDDKTVVVADSAAPEFLPPEKFAHWAKF